MKTLLLDTRILIENPSILGLESNAYKLITTSEVVDEIRESGNKMNISYFDRLELIESAVKYKNIEIISANNPELASLIFTFQSPRLSLKDKGILAFIINSKHNGTEITLATSSKSLKNFASTIGISILSKKELALLISGLPEVDEESNKLQSKLSNMNSKRKRTF